MAAPPAIVGAVDLELVRPGAEARLARHHEIAAHIDRVQVEIAAFQGAGDDVGAAVGRDDPPAAGHHAAARSIADRHVGDVEGLVADGEGGPGRTRGGKQKAKQGQEDQRVDAPMQEDRRVDAPMIVWKDEAHKVRPVPWAICSEQAEFCIRWGDLQLVLTLTGTQRPGHGGEGRFTVDTTPVTVGRARGADWVLSDETRFVSSRHFTIDRDGEGFVLTDMSSNGTIVDGTRLNRGEGAPLGDGSLIQLGLYRIDVGVHRADGADPGPEAGDRTVIAPDTGDRTVVAAMGGGGATAFAGGAGGADDEPTIIEPPRVRQRAAPGDDAIVAALAGALGLSADRLAGRGGEDLVREVGPTLARGAAGLAVLSRQMAEQRRSLGTAMRAYGRGDDQDAVAFEAAEDQAALLAALLERAGRAEFAVGGELEELAAHQEAFGAAMQEALFQLLNRLSPMEVDALTPAGLTGKSAAARWLAYNVLWEDLAAEGENGLYDVFLRYFREAYERKLTGV